MMRRKGSFTIEAAIIIPLLLMLIVIVVSIAVDLYQETAELAEEIGEKERMSLITAMYHIDSIKELIFELRK